MIGEAVALDVGRRRRARNRAYAIQWYTTGAFLCAIGAFAPLGYTVALEAGGFLLLALAAAATLRHRKISPSDTLLIDQAGMRMTGSTVWSYTWDEIAAVMAYTTQLTPGFPDLKLDVYGPVPGTAMAAGGRLVRANLGFSLVPAQSRLAEAVESYAPGKYLARPGQHPQHNKSRTPPSVVAVPSIPPGQAIAAPATRPNREH